LYVDNDNIEEDAMARLRRFMELLWRESRPLTATGIVMLAALAASLVALGVDHREILGVPRWLKPVKFAVSTAIYAFTLAWIFTVLPDRQRLKSIVGGLVSAVMVIEVLLIDLQTARGVTSHFNVGTAFDAAVFGIMGVAILIAWVAGIVLTVALFRYRFQDEGFGWALRLGMVITMAGQATGGLMTTPTEAQLASARTSRITVAGAHTVGGPDGGPGLPITGWSREHGDVRVPHFLGLHAVQLLPAAAWLIGPLGAAARRRRAVFLMSAGYFALFAILLAQALAGQALLQPQGPIAIAYAAWTVAAMAGAVLIAAARRSSAAEPSLPFAVSR
jgi:hypothetical protein